MTIDNFFPTARGIMYASLAAVVGASALLTPTAAVAHGVHCGDHGKMVGSVVRDYNESKSGSGLDITGARVELYTSASGSWSAFETKLSIAILIVGD